ncbi:hypothetical protein A0H81_13726 [Grifola frondosa]|uniref:Uncharacterized protein n=1 Tax=Grifola frondosa TaxID=5627 RepID=A0A1C7LQD5_GRIFR|nr:hypothetical protein A0H81_13726 [Grifola frondosa]
MFSSLTSSSEPSASTSRHIRSPSYDSKGKRPLYPNRSWVRQQDSDPTPSLLSRLKSPSLLDRISVPQSSLSLAERLSQPESRSSSSRSTIDVFGEPSHSPANEAEVPSVPEKGRDGSPSPVSEAAVDELLATIFDADIRNVDRMSAAPMPDPDVEMSSDLPPIPPPAAHPQRPTEDEFQAKALEADESFLEELMSPPAPDRGADSDVEMAQAPSASPPPAHPQRPSELDVLEQCRQLIVPQIVKNAQLRDPEVDKEALTLRVQALFTDAYSAEFVRIAQLRQRSDSLLADAPAMKRRIQEDDVSGGDASVPAPPKAMILNVATTSTNALPSHISELHTVSDGVPPGDAPVGNHGDLDMEVDVVPTSAEPQVAAQVLLPHDRRDIQLPEAHTVTEPQPMSSVVAYIPTDGAPIPSKMEAGEHFVRDHDQEPAPPPPPLALKVGSEGHPVAHDSAEPPPQHLPSCVVPGLWSVSVGSHTPNVTEIEFYVSDAVADATRRWARRREQFDIEDQYVSVHLLCLPIDTVAAVNSTLDPSAAPGDVAAALWGIGTVWPRRGTLVIEMNSGKSSETTWLPAHLGPTDGPLDVSVSVRRGLNTIRLVQLCNMSGCVFVVHAAAPLEEERRGIASERNAWMTFVASAMHAESPDDS